MPSALLLRENSIPKGTEGDKCCQQSDDDGCFFVMVISSIPLRIVVVGYCLPGVGLNIED